jgi:hypothetical protein
MASGGKLNVVAAFSKNGRSKVLVEANARKVHGEILPLVDGGLRFYTCERAGTARETKRVVVRL